MTPPLYVERLITWKTRPRGGFLCEERALTKFYTVTGKSTMHPGSLPSGFDVEEVDDGVFERKVGVYDDPTYMMNYIHLHTNSLSHLRIELREQDDTPRGYLYASDVAVRRLRDALNDYLGDTDPAPATTVEVLGLRLTTQLHDELVELMRAGKKIQAIKTLRVSVAASLQSAKLAVEELDRQALKPGDHITGVNTEGIARSGRISHIDLYRDSQIYVTEGGNHVTFESARRGFAPSTVYAHDHEPPRDAEYTDHDGDVWAFNYDDAAWHYNGVKYVGGTWSTVQSAYCDSFPWTLNA